MSPQYIPVLSPTTGMIVSGVIALGLLLLLSAILGALGKKKWQSFEEYLVGRRYWPLITGAARSLLSLRMGLLREHGRGLLGWILRHVVCGDLESPGLDPVHLACRR
jgi:hypothetical protein